MPLITYNHNKIFYIHIPKTGGSSVYNNLLKQGATIEYLSDKLIKDGVTPQHWTYKECKKNILNFHTYNKVTIFRNPEHRLISEFFWQTKERDYLKLSEWMLDAFNEYEKINHYLDNHIRPQVHFISRKNVKVFLHEEYKEMLSYINQNLENEFSWKSRKKKNRLFRNVYKRPLLRHITTPEAYDKFLDFYEQDIRLYKILKRKKL